MNRRSEGDDFGYLIPLDPGTNVIALVASDGGGGNLRSRVLLVVRNASFTAAITSPAFGSFAEGQSNVVSGYISAKIDGGTADEKDVTSVTVNGVATTLGEVDADGNRSFITAANAVPVRTDGGFTALTVEVDPLYTVVYGTLSYVEGYRIKHWWSKAAGFDATFEDLGEPCGEWTIGACMASVDEETVTAWDPIGSTVGQYVIDERSLMPPHGPGILLCATNSFPGYDDVPWADCPNDCFPPASFTNEVDMMMVAGDFTVGLGANVGLQILSTNTAPLGNIHEMAGCTYDGRVEFYAPADYVPGQEVMLTLSNLTYGVAPGATPDLSQVKFTLHGATMLMDRPVAWDNTNHWARYWLSYPQTGEGAVYTIDKNSFSWPAFSWINSVWTNEDTIGTFMTTNHWLSFSGFHNARTLSVAVTTEIRPPFLVEKGVKTKDVLIIDEHGSIVNDYRFVGGTDLLIGYPTGYATFTTNMSGSFPNFVLNMTVDSHCAVCPSPFDIHYDLNFNLDFSKRKGEVSGTHHSFPSYEIDVRNNKVYDYKQQHLWGLLGNHPISLDEKFSWN